MTLMLNGAYNASSLVLGHLQNTSERNPPQAMFRFGDPADIYTGNVFTYICQHCLGGGGYSQIAAPKLTINSSITLLFGDLCTVTSVPTTFPFVVYSCTKNGLLVGFILF